ncbi:DDB1- and CUL4-associated factor 11 [Coccinella septempunctata]|uniref:DDB1- and CUL4-associated factor 11 n=1 Tax=Coccinella septempunctata TaxID=41139 RepID=UPI001D097B7D|nr:DDB1- and CUL4-associated factor 11 [Coccinella septempunctata]
METNIRNILSEGSVSQRYKKEILKLSDFYDETHAMVGLAIPKVGTSRFKNLVNVLGTREIGKTSPYANFTFGNKCRISNKFLPNKPIDLDCYEGKVFCGIFNKDGSRYLTASQDRYLRLYKSDDDSYKKLHTFQAKDVGWSIIDVAFSPDQTCFAYSTWSSNVHMYPVDGDLSKLETIRLVENGRRFCVFSLAFSYDNKEILAASNDGCLYVYDRQQGTRVAKVRAHHYDVNCVTFSDDSSNIIYTGGDDGLIKVWDRRTLRENPSVVVGTLAGHLDGVTFLDSKRDGRYLISNSKDQSIKLWDIRKFIKEDEARAALLAVEMMSWDYRWQEVPKKLSSTDKSWQLSSDTSVMTYRGHSVTKTLIRCRFSPAETTGQEFIYTGGGSGYVVVYNALTGDIVQQYKAHMKCVRDVHWHPKRMEFVSTSWDHSVKRWIFCNDDFENEGAKFVHSRRRRSLRLTNSNRIEENYT